MSYQDRIRPQAEAVDGGEELAPGIAPGKRSLTASFSRDAGTGAAPAAAPDPLIDGFAFLAGELGSAVGVSPRVDAGPDAVAAVRAAGTVAFAQGDTIRIDPTQVDPGSAEGRRIMAHEVVHLAQGQLPDRPWSESSIESEAHRAGDRLAAGDSVGALHAARDPMALAAWHLPGTPAPAHELSPDGFLLEAHHIRVERGWYDHHYGSSAAAGNRDIANRLILQRLGESTMPWITSLSPADLAHAVAELRLHIGDFEMNDIATAPIENSVYTLVGLPPGINVLWDFPAVAGPAPPPPPPDPGVVGPPAPVPPMRMSQLMVRASAEPAASHARMSAPLLGEALDRLESRVGATLLPGVREDLISGGHLGEIETPGLANQYFPFARSEMIRIFGEGAWLAFERRLAGSGDVASDEGAASGEMADPGIPTEEQHFCRRMLEEIFAGAPAGSGSARITTSLVAVLHEIDAHPERARIIEALRNAPTTAAPSGDLASSLRQAMQSVDMRAEYDRLGITPSSAPAAPRAFPWPVNGRIVNHTDLLFITKEAAFSVEVTSNETPPLMMTVPWVHVHWVVRRTTARETSAPVYRTGDTAHRHMLEPAERFTLSFAEVGTYEINAVVDHDNFAPNHFTIFCEVRTEDERFAEVQDRAFTPGMWGDRDVGPPAPPRRMLGTSATDVFNEGTSYEGDMPIECDPNMPIPGSLDALNRRIAQVEGYRDSGRLDAAGQSWAESYLTAMNEARARITTELSSGWRSVMAEGAYLSRGEGATSTPLQIVATAQHTAAGWKVAIHDMTQAFDARNSRYDGENDPVPRFSEAAEYTFSQLAKSYPRGRMALRIEMLHDTTGEPTGRYVGFELECNSTWEAVRSVAYHPVVAGVINIAGTCVALFVPPAAPFIIPTLIAYNAVDTVATMVDLGAREALTWRDGVIGAAQIAIDVIPYVGRASRMIAVGGRTYRVMEGLETAGEILLMTAQAEEQVQGIRMGVVRQAAEIHARITELEATNPSDPELPGLRAQFTQLQRDATDAWATVGLQMAAQQGLMRMSMRTLHGIHAAHTARVDAARTHLTESMASPRGHEPITGTDRGHVQDVMGVRVGTWEGGGDGVRIAFDVGATGGITNVRMEIGPTATLDRVMRHEATLTAMRRYEGLTGSLRNLLERVTAWQRGGGHIPPHTRAFEARFELQKLPPIIASLRAEIAGRPIGDTTRARLEEQANALQAQLNAHGPAFNDLAPGLGYVASADTTSPVAAIGGDADATMGTRPGGTHGIGPMVVDVGTVVPVPTGRSTDAHARLVARRGSDRVPLATGARRSGWTALDEAHFRWGGGHADAAAFSRLVPTDEPYHWTSDGTGNPILARDSAEPRADGTVSPQRDFSAEAMREGRTTFEELFPPRGDIRPAGFVAADAPSDFRESGFTPTGAAAADIATSAAARRAAMSRRADSDAAVTRLATELGVTPESLSSTADATVTIERLRREANGDAARLARIDELARQRGLLTDARRDLTQASERAGNTMAMEYMRSRHADYTNLHPGGTPTVPGRSGEFDFVYVRTGPPLSVVVVEAKGASSGLGVGAGGTAQQGSPEYLTHLARQMLGSATDPHLRQALQAIIDRDAGGTADIHYVLVEAPMETATTTGTPAATTGGDPRSGRIREFSL